MADSTSGPVPAPASGRTGHRQTKSQGPLSAAGLWGCRARLRSRHPVTAAVTAIGAVTVAVMNTVSASGLVRATVAQAVRRGPPSSQTTLMVVSVGVAGCGVGRRYCSIGCETWGWGISCLPTGPSPGTGLVGLPIRVRTSRAATHHQRWCWRWFRRTCRSGPCPRSGGNPRLSSHVSGGRYSLVHPLRGSTDATGDGHSVGRLHGVRGQPSRTGSEFQLGCSRSFQISESSRYWRPGLVGRLVTT